MQKTIDIYRHGSELIVRTDDHGFVTLQDLSHGGTIVEMVEGEARNLAAALVRAADEISGD